MISPTAREGDMAEQEESRESTRPGPQKTALSPFRLPGETAPTWEVELLLSGATLFTLMQVPAWLNAELLFWDVRLGGELQELVGMAGMFAKVIAYTLIFTLVAHLMTRALWVATIGLRSVYPGGIRWRRLRYGPHYRAVARRELPTLKRLIDRSDDIASQMFAVAALMVVATLFSLITTALLVLLAWLLALPFGGHYFEEFLVTLVSLWMGASLLANWLDRRFKRRKLSPLWMRWLAPVQRLHLRMPLSRLSTGLMLVFSSRFGAVRGTLILLALLYALMGIAVADMLWDRARLSAGEARFIPQLDGAHVLQSSHYADQRDPLVHALVPYVPSLQARGEYLRLVIPYRVQQHPDALESLCPGAEPGLRTAAAESHAAYRALDADPATLQRVRDAESAEAEAATRVLECASRLHGLRLNEEPVEVPLSFRIGTEAELPALLAMIPIGHLPRGRHVLEVARLPVAARDGLLFDREPRPAAAPWRITFWK
jgi:hypothetical protein